MKILKSCAFCAIILCCFVGQPHAQGALQAADPKPALFSDLPDSLLIDVAQMEHLLLLNDQQSGEVRTARGFSLQGKVVSVGEAAASAMRSVVFRSSNRLGAVFTLTRINDAGGKTLYTGRVLSRVHSDAFELVQHLDRYYLVKRSYQEMNEE